MSAVRSLLHPLSKEEFFCDFFEKSHVHISADDPQRFSGLISFERLDEIVGTYGLAFPDVSLVDANKEIDKSQYIWKKELVDPTRVAALFANGATIIFNSLQDRVEQLRLLCDRLSDELQLRLQTNIYLTPGCSRGFAPHWDTHDVLVLQVEGAKRWQIYQERLQLPLEKAKYKFEPNAIDRLTPREELTTKPGDVLYIPRGLMHSAESLSEMSLHITLGVIPYTWADLMHDAISLAADRNSDLRSVVPFWQSNAESLQNKLLSNIGDLEIGAEIQQAIQSHGRRVKSSLRPRSDSLLRQSSGVELLQPDDIIMLHDHIFPEVSRSADEQKIVLRVNDREVVFPVAAQQTIELALSGERKQLGEYDDGLDWDSRSSVVSVLLKEGFVTKCMAIKG